MLSLFGFWRSSSFQSFSTTIEESWMGLKRVQVTFPQVAQRFEYLEAIQRQLRHQGDVVVVVDVIFLILEIEEVRPVLGAAGFAQVVAGIVFGQLAQQHKWFISRRSTAPSTIQSQFHPIEFKSILMTVSTYRWRPATIDQFKSYPASIKQLTALITLRLPNNFQAPTSFITFPALNCDWTAIETIAVLIHRQPQRIKLNLGRETHLWDVEYQLTSSVIMLQWLRVGIRFSWVRTRVVLTDWSSAVVLGLESLQRNSCLRSKLPSKPTKVW